MRVMKFNPICRWIAAVMFAASFAISSHVWAEQDTWKVNLKEADIRVLVSQIADITGKTFVVDPRVKGKVTVVSNTALPTDEVYQLFLSVLQVHGYTAVESGQVVKVIQQNEVKQEGAAFDGKRRKKGEEVVTRVIKVTNTSAIELVPILRPMVAKYGHLAGVASANSLIISDHVTNIERMMAIIKNLDSSESEELEVVQLEHAWVGDLKGILEKLIPDVSKAKNSTISVVADERSNRLIVKGEKSARQRIVALVSRLDQPVKQDGSAKVIYLKHADAEKVAETLKGLVTEGATGKENKGQQKANILADKDMNALVVKASPSDMAEIEDVIRQLDIRRAQVLIESVIVEVQGNVGDNLGIQWALGGFGDVPALGTNFGNVGLSTAQVLGAIASESTDVTPGNGFIGGIGAEGGDFSWGVLIQALESVTNSNLLSTPSIMTLDNQEAEIVVGQNVPFITGSTTTSGDGTANPFQTIERQDVGVTLKVVPKITDGDVVMLDVEQEVESVSKSSVSGASDIVTDKRTLKTSILVDNRQTIVLGGLISDEVTEDVQKVPLLGDIPWLGELFKSTSISKAKRNLLVFLRPTIQRNREDVALVTEKKYQGLWELKYNNYQAKKGLNNEEAEGVEIIAPTYDEFFEGQREIIVKPNQEKPAAE
ncbi:type II secretion system protein D [Litoribrevibacter albus]|uniref:Type II secretion system protein D n=2 Tax=Litoribrevibacter albus TaxID=1473156 RepID=A0AA37W6C6_9GAMM|nr:type II secretion system protein D [Litoribrevibacter albus]